MKLYAPLAFAFIAAPVFAQTSADSVTLSSRIGPAFYTDDSMTTLRSPEEIEAGWANLGPEDQGALRNRCLTIGINSQANMTESSGGSGSGVEPSEGVGAPAQTAGTPQEALTESSGNAGAGVEPTEGIGAAAETASTPQEALTDSSGSAGSGVEPTEEAGSSMTDDQLAAICDSVAGF